MCIIINLGKYYLVYSGYTTMPSSLSTCRKERYHLNQYANSNPIGQKELFNYRYVSLRKVTECCFGVLKTRFSILKKIPPYNLGTQKYIVIACCAIHNFIRINARIDKYFDEQEEISEVQATNTQNTIKISSNNVEFNISRSQLCEMARVCDEITEHI